MRRAKGPAKKPKASSGRAPLAGIDLNLLLALDALLLEENVTRAAARIGLSQPATSHALARLRELLQDPLLIRQGSVMQPSALGRQLAPEVRRLLTDVEATLFGHRQFEPSSSSRTFRVAANDYCGAVLLPDFVARMRRAAPRTRLDVREQRGQAPVAELARGELDLALGTFLEPAPDLTTQVLFEERFVCLVRRGHPAIRRKLSLEAYAALDHVLVVSPGYGPGVVDHALAQLGLQRSVAVRVPHFLVAPAIVAKSDLIVTLPARLGSTFAAVEGLTELEPPLALRSFPVSAAWHPRAALEPASVWLRGVLAAAVSGLRAG